MHRVDVHVNEETLQTNIKLLNERNEVIKASSVRVRVVKKSEQENIVKVRKIVKSMK